VSGATPSLDVGAYTFFAHPGGGGDIAPTFDSVPLNARFELSIESASAAFPDAIYDGLSSNISAGTWKNPAFSPDGTTLYLLRTSGTDQISTYPLSTAWDITTLGPESSYATLNVATTFPKGLVFSSDGTKMYVGDTSDNMVTYYTLGTAWDISTLAYVGEPFDLTVDGGATYFEDFAFSADGFKFYIMKDSDAGVRQFTLSTAWDLATAVYDTVELVIETETTSPQAIKFASDGMTLYTLGYISGDTRVFKYDLTTAWDLATATYDDSLDISAASDSAIGLAISDDETVITALKQSDYEMRQYVRSPTTITLPASVQNVPQKTFEAGDRVTYTFFTMDTGTTVHLLGEQIT
jgi:sugar lactone lactonase YvrE